MKIVKGVGLYEEKNHPFTRKSRFRVASVSKMFTMFTIMQLVEQGKLNLDDDVSKYLGFTLRNPYYPNTPITVSMLASHQSSLRDGKIYSIPPQMGLQEFFRKDGNFYEDGALRRMAIHRDSRPKIPLPCKILMPKTSRIPTA